VQKILSVGALLQHNPGRWLFPICEDGNGIGIRTPAIASGVDLCVEGPHDVTAMFA
jgi:hypothetical protein